MTKGKFIVFEGLDLTGKSTIVKNLKAKHPELIYTREPGGTDCNMAEDVRNVILSHNGNMDPLVEAYLFASSRAEHVKQIKEWLREGKTVVCDRFLYSSIYYQGIVKGLGEEMVKEINRHAVEDLRPDVVFFVTTSEAERNRRMEVRKEEFNALDRLSASLNYTEANLQYYRVVSNSCGCNAVVLDTTDNNSERCLEEIEKELSNI